VAFEKDTSSSNDFNDTDESADDHSDFPLCRWSLLVTTRVGKNGDCYLNIALPAPAYFLCLLYLLL
jgi:hypothetical protein